VSVRVSHDRVQIVSATPHPGYTADQNKYSDTASAVTFTADRKMSRVLVRWMNGPYAEVTETAP
jgi:hypothetical protein